MQFVSVYEGCQSTPIMDGLKDEERVAWDTFYSGCKEIEQSTVAMLRPVDVKMFRILVSSAIEAQQGQAEMLGGGQLSTPIVGPLPDLNYPPSLPGVADDFEAGVQQYHAECTTQNILTCVPECAEASHGYELLATIDGTDTQFSCNVHNLLFSWVGAATLGGYIGADAAAFLSAVLSGAAGLFMVTTDTYGMGATVLNARFRQSIHVTAVGSQPVAWGVTDAGVHTGANVANQAEVHMSNLRLGKSTVDAGGKLVLVDCLFQGIRSGQSTDGGALSIQGAAHLVNTMFDGNTGADGGAIYITSSAAHVRIETCSFTSNAALWDHSDDDGRGTAIYIQGGASAVHINGCTFSASGTGYSTVTWEGPTRNGNAHTDGWRYSDSQASSSQPLDIAEAETTG
jgi:hypothetical protein